MSARLRALLGHPRLALAFRLYLGGLFIYASIYKIQYPAEFAESIAAYQIVPHFLVNPMAAVLPWLELICGTLAVAGLRVRAALAVMAGLMAAFTLSLAWVVALDIPIGCGCFTGQEAEAGPLTLLRDLAWLAMALHAWAFDRLFHLENRFTWKVSELPCPPA
ncbi:MAG: MauE/DoxX family redox-associated membrane protein [Thermodesulfobacteriota bacterium]